MSFWISFCGELEEGYKPDFSISFEKPEYRNGYTSINVCHQERVDHLKATIEVLNTDSLQNLAAYIENHQDYIKSLQDENARLREALEFYADVSVWGNGCAAIDPCDTYTCDYGVLRGGRRAREALKDNKSKCTHPYNGNMCLETNPGEQCNNCGCYGYND
jgi:hypothetical protein